MSGDQKERYIERRKKKKEMKKLKKKEKKLARVKKLNEGKDDVFADKTIDLTHKNPYLDPNMTDVGTERSHKPTKYVGGVLVTEERDFA